MRRLGVGLVVLALAAAAPAAGAVTPQQARAVAERAITAGPDAGPFDSSGPLIEPAAKRRLRPVVEIHRLGRALKRGAKVGQGVEPARRAKRVKSRSFLLWGDYAPGAGFVHPSRLVLVDAATGRITLNRLIGWWPEVNGKRVFKRGRGRLARPRVGPVARSAALVPGFRNDCLVTIGDRTDPHFLKGIAAMTRSANSTGMPSAAAREVRDLGPAIDALARRDPPCKDVMIYIGGHGWAPKNSKIKVGDRDVAKSEKARVTIKAPGGGGNRPVEEPLDFDDVKKIIHARPHLSFKLVVESCFSGRWVTLMAEPNLRIALTSSGQSEVTFLAVTHAQRGMQVDGAIQWDESAPVGKADDPDDPPPFTKGLTEAVDDWAADPANQNGELGQALGYGGKHREGDRARALGWQHGKTDDRTDTRGVGPGEGGGGQPTPFTLTVTGTYRHIAPGSSETCWRIQTNPPRPNAVVTITVRGPNDYSQSRTDSTDASGVVQFRTPISQTGTYTAEVHATAEDGATASGSGSVVVNYPAPGTCPAP
jgi:hypothetical protein